MEIIIEVGQKGVLLTVVVKVVVVVVVVCSVLTAIADRRANSTFDLVTALPGLHHLFRRLGGGRCCDGCSARDCLEHGHPPAPQQLMPEVNDDGRI